jgi:Na+-driven multidrug efflux pump
MAPFNMIYGLFIAFCVGNGNVVRMLTSVLVGEEDKASMRRVLKIVLTKGLAVACLVGLVAIFLAPFLSGMFFPPETGNVYELTKQLFIVYGFCIPFILIVQVSTNYLQATGHTAYVNFQSVFDGFFSIVIPSALLAPKLGAFGVWLANPIGIILTLLTVLIYEIIYWKRLPRNVDEWMLLRPGFGVADKDCLDIYIRNIEEVEKSSEIVQDFCDAHDMFA